MNTSNARQAILFALAVLPATTFLLLSSAAFGASDRLACEFTSLRVIQQTFAYPVSRVKRFHFAYSPTAAPPRDHSLNGGDLSVCNAYAWKGGPYPKSKFDSINGLGLFSGHPVPNGLGILHVSTYVRDENQGSRFDAEKWFTELVSIGGTHRVAVPSFGSTRSYGGWFFKKNQEALGMWQAGEDGVIEIEVYAHRDAVDSLRSAARLTVPNFGLSWTPSPP